jgi:hypothetical protein
MIIEEKARIDIIFSFFFFQLQNFKTLPQSISLVLFEFKKPRSPSLEARSFGTHMKFKVLAILLTTISVSSLEVTVIDGRIQPSNKYVGMFTSQIQSEVVNTLFPHVQTPPPAIVDNKVLRFLNLEGDYKADVPLILPSFFVLRLNGSIVDAENLTSSDYNGFNGAGLIWMNSSTYSSIQGGIVDATKHPQTQMQAVSVLNGIRNVVRSVRAKAQFETAIGIRGGTQNEVSYCDAGGDSNSSMIPVRAIWTIATSKAYVHHNHVHHSQSHALDFDAYTSSSIAWENLCEDNKDEGIFVEETAHDNVICMNTCRRNGNGIGVYSHTVGPVKSNVRFVISLSLSHSLTRPLRYFLEIFWKTTLQTEFRQVVWVIKLHYTAIAMFFLKT